MSSTNASQLYFDPDCHPDDTLKSFVEFSQDYELRYAAMYPDPPKVSLDSAIQRWKLGNNNRNPTMTEYDDIIDQWKSKDMVAKFLGIYASRRFVSDWTMALPVEKSRKEATWLQFKETMQLYYKPTENLTLKHFQFRSLCQEREETFIAFCNRVEKEAKHCQFSCDNQACTALAVAVRDQVIIGMSSEEIREEALKNSWDLASLRKEGMRLESAAKSASEISGEGKINKVYGKYSRKNPNRKQTLPASNKNKQTACFFCGIAGRRQDILIHAKECPAKQSVCSKCDRTGHYATVCKSSTKPKAVNELTKETTPEEGEKVYNVNLFRISNSNDSTEDFKTELLINNHLDTVLADTGAGISVCSLETAKRWNIADRMTKTNLKIKPYKSKSIPAIGASTCSVSFGDRTIPVQWYIIKETCESILSGSKASQLGIVKFNATPDVLMPIRMIELSDERLKENLQEIIVSKASVFKGIGKLKHHTVKLPYDTSIKPVAEPPRRIPYHLKSRVEETIADMVSQNVIEELPTGQQTPWISNIVIAPKDDGNIRVTLDAKNLNKALLSSNYPIPRSEDIKAQLSGKKVFSKIDLKSAFWQLEIAEEARNLTVFHASGKLYRYKRLVMGLKPSQGELNAALQPLFAKLPEVHVIHDDIIIATEDESSHVQVTEQVLSIIQERGLTLNKEKCKFGAKEIKFWGMIISAAGIRPDPEKVEALNHMTIPNNKEELISFLCMMQSNSDFIEGFAQKASTLRELTKKNTRFKWEKKHNDAFFALIRAFREDVLLRYFDPDANTFIIVDGHKTGLGAILAQGPTLKEAKPVAVASRATNASESHCPQLDLEAASLDFGLRRFREYVVGSPTLIKVITDHKPLVHIFNGRRNGSIRTRRIKLNHQDIPYIVEFQKGSLNQVDYMSRHARSISSLPVDQRKECNEINNLLYTLHTTQIIDHITLANIAIQTKQDKTLSKIQEYLKKGYSKIPQNESDEVKKFGPILTELTIVGNGIIFKDDRIVLPETLQELAIELAHRGSHPGQSGIERRLRFHFFFHGMYERVKKFVMQCKECAIFVDKKTKEPIKSHKVPSKCWETVAVDLFGPMPSSKHIVVVQDLGSRYPAAKLVASTKAEKVIPALEEIYDEYGYPETQISDNGPPFSSRKMKEFNERHGTTARFSTPHFPSQNPVETFMKTIGKTMKIDRHTNKNESKALREALKTYRQTPHPATGIPPANMMFRDGLNHKFPQKGSTDEDVKGARESDAQKKMERQETINSSKYRTESKIYPGDLVLVRDWTRRSKFDPIFLSTPFIVIELNQEMKNVLLQDLNSSKTLLRHLDDVKEYNQEIPPPVDSKDNTQISNGDLETLARQILEDDHEGETVLQPDFPIPDNIPDQTLPQARENFSPRRSKRVPKARRRYIEMC